MLRADSGALVMSLFPHQQSHDPFAVWLYPKAMLPSVQQVLGSNFSYVSGA